MFDRISLELRRLSWLAIPMILTMLSQMGMGVADTIMAGHVSAADLAGVSLGGAVFWPALLFLSGIIMSLTPTVSQLHGAGKESEAGEVVRQALWIAFILGLLLIYLMGFAEALYRQINVDPLAIPIAVDYLNNISWGLLPLLGYFALRYLCEGMSWTTPAMIIAVCALAIKVPLNNLFIYGGYGIPAMGGAGCGWSSAIVMTAEFIALLVVVIYSRIAKLGVFDRFSWPNLQEIFRLMKLGLPIGLSMFLEMAVFSAMSLMVGILGVEKLAAHQIAQNVGGICFMVPLAIGMAASVRVGFNVGQGDLQAARLSGYVAQGLAAIFALVAGLLVYFYRGDIAGAYSNDLEVVLLGAELMFFVAMFQLFDGVQTTCIGALRGYKDTSTPMYIAVIAYWGLALPIGAGLGFGKFGLPDLGVNGFWIGMTVGLGIAAVVLASRYKWLSSKDGRIMELAQH